MKFILILVTFIHIFCITHSQEITVEFKPVYRTNPLDSVVVQNLETTEIMSILPEDSLILTLPTPIETHNSDTPIFYWKHSADGMDLYATSSLTDDIYIRVFDETGKTRVSKKVQCIQGQPVIHISNLTKRVYFLHIISHEQSLLFAGKFLYNTTSSLIPYPKSNTTINLKRLTTLHQMAYEYDDVIECIGYFQNTPRTVHISPSQDTCIYFSFMETVTDIENNEYNTIQIGNQTWFADNLQTSTYTDGTPIPNIIDNTEWTQATSDAYCDVYNNSDTAAIYGKLYNWYAVETEKLCPTGWHVPSNEEWTELRSYLISQGFNYDSTTVDNKIAKSLAQTFGWQISTQEGAVGDSLELNNSTGFSALPAGNRGSNNGVFNSKNYSAFWWSSSQESTTEALRWSIGSSSIGFTNSVYPKKMGYSVRCIKDSF